MNCQKLDLDKFSQDFMSSIGLFITYQFAFQLVFGYGYYIIFAAIMTSTAIAMLLMMFGFIKTKIYHPSEIYYPIEIFKYLGYDTFLSILIDIFLCFVYLGQVEDNKDYFLVEKGLSEQQYEKYLQRVGYLILFRIIGFFIIITAFVGWGLLYQKEHVDKEWARVKMEETIREEEMEFLEDVGFND